MAKVQETDATIEEFNAFHNDLGALMYNNLPHDGKHWEHFRDLFDLIYVLLKQEVPK